MKYSEFIRLAKRNGWILKRQAKGSHEIYAKDGIEITVPNHGAKEMPKGLEISLKKQMGL